MATEASASTNPTLRIDQAAPCISSSLTLTALAEHHARLLALPDDVRDETDDLQSVENLMLGLEPTSINEVLALAYVVEIELDTLAANHDECRQMAMRLHKALGAICRGLVNYGGAKSPMVVPD